MTPQYEKLIEILREMFQMDQADLDFGIYRIMNAKRAEIEKFLKDELLPQVQTEFSSYRGTTIEDKKKELAELEKKIKNELGMNPDEAPKVKELRAEIAKCGDDAALANEVFSHLASFFRRYYDNGDFLSLRRYKKDTYAIPYEGEEVKLHWANSDQYYIKSSEFLKDYAFKLPRGKKAHFKLVDATQERDNNKTQAGKERRFILNEAEPVVVKGDECFIQFVYLSDKEKQDKHTKRAVEVLKGEFTKSLKDFQDLFEKTPTEKNKERTLLEKHLEAYTARFNFDFFIHKDLGAFLKRELDFYIKNEVLFVDDLDANDDGKLHSTVAKVKVLKHIANKIIAFLAQLEDFQKKLWLKKKFVVESGWCITLDRIPESLYPEIVKNDAQREEWIKLFAIDTIKKDLVRIGYSNPLSTEFLKQNTNLPLDTRHFSQQFADKLLSEMDSIDEVCTGTIVNSENFQGLNLLSSKAENSVDTIYIDPPFNLGDNADFLYKTDYMDSTWLSLLSSRLNIALGYLKEKGFLFVRCDYHGAHLVRTLLESIGLEVKAEILLDRSRNEAGSPNKMEVTYEHLFMASRKGVDVDKYTVPRSLANIKWTGFLMAGDRNPPERHFLGIKMLPPAGQHWSLIQAKVDKLLSEFHLRLRCKDCGAYYYKSASTQELTFEMKKPANRFKFYDIMPSTKFHGVETLDKCLECKCETFKVEYLGSDEVFINDRWLDIPSYSRRWDFSTENAEDVLWRVLRFKPSGSTAMDFFLGSGTSAAVAQKMAQNWIGFEMGEHFNVAINRMKSVLNGENSGVSSVMNWKGGGVFKHMRLESYDDTLDNLVVRRSPEQEKALEKLGKEAKEDYTLSYMLDLESKGSDCLLNIEKFTDPFNYTLNIRKDNELKPCKVDLVETFNYLIGLNVEQMSTIRGFKVLSGKLRTGEKTLVIWRNTKEKSNAELDEFFKKHEYKTKDSEFDLIFVNGDNNLENLKVAEDKWKVCLIEEEFKKRMFEAVN